MHRWRTWILICSAAFLSEAASAAGHLAIIVDDIGYNRSQSLRAARLPGNFTLAVLPFTPHGQEVAQLAQARGKELMLHLPMSNIANMPLGKGGLHSGMSRADLLTTLRADLADLPFVKGVNNHMGSRLTQDADAMQWLMEELAPRGLYFVDSRTSAQTLALDTARANQIPSVKRDVFLDDDESPAAIAAQLARALAMANQQGSAVAIGHPYQNTMALLENIQPYLERAGVSLVFASQLTKTPTAFRRQPAKSLAKLLYCPVPPGSLRFSREPPVDLYDKIDMILQQFQVIDRSENNLDAYIQRK